MKVLCNKTTKKVEGFSRRDEFDFDPSTHIVIDVNEMPDMDLDRLNNNEDGLRPATSAELDADIELEKDKKVDFSNVDPFLKAFVVALNKGTIVAGSNMTVAELKAAIRAEF